jgi:hypothetical protein
MNSSARGERWIALSTFLSLEGQEKNGNDRPQLEVASSYLCEKRDDRFRKNESTK